MSVGYDESTFLLGGDPDAIGDSATRWRTFAAEAAGAADALRRLDTEEFTGDEADQFRRTLDADLPHRLRTSGEAWNTVADALVRFRVTLDECQQQLRPLAARASDSWHAICTDRADSERADPERAPRQVAAYRGSVGDTPALSQPESGPCPADRRLQRATVDLAALTDRAHAIRARHDAAREACAAEIRRAAAMRFAEPPGWFSSLISTVGGWISDHADLLRGISAVLKQISSISGMLAMIPVLAPVMAPISVATGASAVVVDGAVMAATGQGSWSDLVLDGAAMLPGAKAAMAVGTVQTAVAVKDAADGDGSWGDVLATAASVAIGAKGGHGTPARHAGPDRAPSHPEAGPGNGTPDGEVGVTTGAGDVATAAPSTTPGYGDEVPPPAEAVSGAKTGESDAHTSDSDPSSDIELPAHIPPDLADLYRAGKAKVPAEWDEPIVNSKGNGLRWFARNRSEAGVRIDRAEPRSPFATQRVDHVIVRTKGRVLGPDGIPVINAIDKDYWAHIPLGDWLGWTEWNAR